MKAVLFDVYGTLLIGKRVADREAPLREIADRFGLPFPTGESITAELDRRIRNAHRASGESHPEVDIREIWQGIFPDLEDPDAFALEAENAVHQVRPANGARETILRLHRDGVMIGIVSNAQAYTRTLLERHLGPAWNGINPDLAIFSYEHRMAKPEPALFQLAVDRLGRHGIPPSEILMVGDSRSKDIEPARRLGLQTQLVQAESIHLP